MWIAALACAVLPQIEVVELPHELPEFEVITTDGEFISDEVLRKSRFVVFLLSGVDAKSVARLQREIGPVSRWLDKLDVQVVTLVEADEASVREFALRQAWPSRIAAIPSSLFGYGELRDKLWSEFLIEGNGSGEVQTRMMNCDWKIPLLERFEPKEFREVEASFPNLDSRWSRYAIEGVRAENLLIQPSSEGWHGRLQASFHGDPADSLQLEGRPAYLEGRVGEVLAGPMVFSSGLLEAIPVPTGFPTAVVWRDEVGGELARVDFLRTDWSGSRPYDFEAEGKPEPIQLAHQRFLLEGIEFEVWAEQVDFSGRFLVKLTNRRPSPVWANSRGSYGGSNRIHSILRYESDPPGERRGWVDGIACGPSEALPILDKEHLDRYRLDPGEAWFLTIGVGAFRWLSEMPELAPRLDFMDERKWVLAFHASPPQGGDSFYSTRAWRFRWSAAGGIRLDLESGVEWTEGHDREYLVPTLFATQERVMVPGVLEAVPIDDE